MTREFQITVLSGPSVGDVFRFALESGSALQIGRDQSCELVLQDPMVSRTHARIASGEDGLFLTDLGSTHGSVHMGFPLRPGEEGRRWLQNGDEFKIGNAIFRIGFEEKAPAADEPTAGDTIRLSNLLYHLTHNRKMLVRAAVIAILALVLVYLLTDVGGEPSLPPQASHVPLALPQEPALGFLPGGGDVHHLDKVQFVLPASDLVIEFEYISETPVEVFVDETRIENLPSQPGGWDNVVLIYRDAKIGSERRLVVDNTASLQGGAKPKRWGVRNVRTTPLSRDFDPQVERALNGTLGLVDRIHKTPDSLSIFLRSLHGALLEALAEASLDGVGYRISLESQLPNRETMRSRLEGLLTERVSGITSAMQSRHLQELVLLAGQFDAELWRKTNLGLSKARIAADQKDFIEAHDTLLALKSLFPDDTDFRYVLADRAFTDNRVVPAKVRTNPDRFRRKKPGK